MSQFNNRDIRQERKAALTDATARALRMPLVVCECRREAAAGLVNWEDSDQARAIKDET